MAWKDLLPQELKDDPSLKDFKDDDKEALPALAKSFIDTKKFVGASIRPPGADAGPEARKEFIEKLKKLAPELVPLDDTEEGQKAVWQKLGRPEKPEEYDAKPPDGMDIDLDSLRASAVNAGLTKKQFTKLVEMTVVGRQKQTDAMKADQGALKTEWGAAYDAKLKTAASAARKLEVPDNVVKAIESGGIHSSQLKIWDKIAKAIGAGEGSPIAQQGASGSGTVMTPAEAETQVAEIQGRPDKAYFDQRHPLHGSLVKKVQELMKFIVKD